MSSDFYVGCCCWLVLHFYTVFAPVAFDCPRCLCLCVPVRTFTLPCLPTCPVAAPHWPRCWLLPARSTLPRYLAGYAHGSPTLPCCCYPVPQFARLHLAVRRHPFVPDPARVAARYPSAVTPHVYPGLQLPPGYLTLLPRSAPTVCLCRLPAFVVAPPPFPVPGCCRGLPFVRCLTYLRLHRSSAPGYLYPVSCTLPQLVRARVPARAPVAPVPQFFWFPRFTFTLPRYRHRTQLDVLVRFHLLPHRSSARFARLWLRCRSGSPVPFSSFACALRFTPVAFDYLAALPYVPG